MPFARSLALAAAALALASAAQAAQSPPAWQPYVPAAAAYAARAGRLRLLLGAHRAPCLGRDARVRCRAPACSRRCCSWRTSARPASATGRCAPPTARCSPDGPVVRQRPPRRRASHRGDAGLVRLARRAGMRRFRPAAPVWGLSSVDAADQSRYLLHIDRLVPRRHRAYAMRLLGSIVPSQRWGIARVRRPGGLCTSRAAGARAAARWTTRWRSCVAEGAGCRWRS